MKFSMSFKVSLDGGRMDGEMEFESLSHTEAVLMVPGLIHEWAQEKVLGYSDVKITEWRKSNFDALEWAVARVRNARNRQDERNEAEEGKGDMLVASAAIHLNTVMDGFPYGTHPVEVAYP